MSVHSVPRDPTLNTLIRWHQSAQRTSAFLVGTAAIACTAFAARMSESLSPLGASLLVGASVGLSLLALKAESAIKNAIARKIKNQILHELQTAPDAILHLRPHFTNYLSEIGTELHLAVRQGKGDFVQVLIDLGNDVNAREQRASRATPLHLAAGHGNTEIGRILIQAGADPNAQSDHNLYTPLHIAVEQNHLEFVRLLTNAEADLHAQLSNGDTPLHLSPNAEMTQLLIQAGADPNVQSDPNLYTPLHIAVEQSQSDLMQLLIAIGANINAQTSSGDTPLHLAVRRERPYAVKSLLQAGADSAIPNSQGKIPLEIAVNPFIYQTFTDYTRILHQKLFTDICSTLRDPGTLIAEYDTGIRLTEEDPAESLKYLFT